MICSLRRKSCPSKSLLQTSVTPSSKYCLFALYWLFWFVLHVCWLTHWRRPKQLQSHFFFYLFCWMSRSRLPCFFAMKIETFLQSDSRLRWEVTKCKYVVDVLKSILQVSGLHLSIPFFWRLISFTPDICTHLSLLLPLEKRAHYFCV